MTRALAASLAAATGLAGLAGLTLRAAPAAAEPGQLGAWFGPRIFSSDSALGLIPDADEHHTLSGAMAFGARFGLPLGPWLVPEAELAFAPTDTTRTRTLAPVRAYWLEPRLQLRFELRPGRRAQPFLLVGGGTSIVLSSQRTTLEHDVLGTGYLGGGVRLDSRKGFVLRLDARVAFLAGIERFIAPEVEVGAGIEIALGKRPPRPGPAERRAPGIADARAADRDGDGLPDAQDACPDRPEDADGFDDQDGCPDIDNDLDRVLDIADRCPTVPETYNGFEDDDGCPDALPPEVDALKGTIEGLLYAEGETMVRDSARASLATIVKTMTAHPTIRVVLIGHTDDREAQQFATGDPDTDLAALSADLSRARAEAVKQALAAAGIAAPRIDVEGHGAEEPVSDNDKPRGRLANRRVEIKLYVPPSGQR